MTGENNSQTESVREQKLPDREPNTEPSSDLEIQELNSLTDAEALKEIVTKVNELEQSQESLAETVQSLENTVDEFKTRIEVLESRADHITDGIESVEIELKQTRDDVNRETDSLEERIAALEAELGVADADTTTAQISQDACELERISQMPKEMREKEMSRSVNRAVIIWEHFDEWSKPVANGQLLPSNEIKKLLGARLDTKLEWVQVYRVKDAFENNTSDKYEQIETPNSGKAIMREYSK